METLSYWFLHVSVWFGWLLQAIARSTVSAPSTQSPPPVSTDSTISGPSRLDPIAALVQYETQTRDPSTVGKTTKALEVVR